MSLLDNLALEAVKAISPSGSLAQVALQNANPELDKLLADFDTEERALEHLSDPSLVERLETDFALCVPAITDASIPLTAWAIPILSALAGPCAPLLSVGLQVACKVGLYALTAWAKRRLAAPGGTS